VVFGDPSSGLLHISNHIDNIPNITKLVKGLSKGQTVKGKVLEVYTNGKSLIRLNRQKLTVETNVSLIKGQEIEIQVEQLKPNPLFKILPINPTKHLISSNDISSLLTNASNVSPKLSRYNYSELILKDADVSRLNLQPGQNLKGPIIGIINENIVKVKIRGISFPVLLLDDNLSKNQGAIINLQVRKSPEGVFLQTPTTSIKALDSSLLKGYLPSKQDFGAMAAGLQKLILGETILKEARIDSNLIHRMKHTLKILLPNDYPDAVDLKAQVDRSGINYESKIKRNIEKEMTSDSRLEITRDLKGQLLRLQSLLEKFLSRESKVVGEPLLTTIRQTVGQVKMAADNIEFQQLSNQYSRQEQQSVLIQIPDPFYPENRTAKLYFRCEGENSEKRSKSSENKYNLVFLLNLSAIGNLRIDTGMRGNIVSSNIGSDNEHVVKFITANISRLKKQLKMIGYQADISCSLHESAAMDVENKLERKLIKDSTHLVDLKT
tara:strand:+ start:1902 stop:3380 length:1479 start_codon:yes stop_codon:yes gene_type:complete